MAATDPKTKDDVLDRLRVAIPAIRQRRLPIETGWILNHACWRAKKTHHYYTEGQSDHYIPAARHRIEKFVTRCRKQLIPTQEFFEVYPWDDAAPDGAGAERVKAYLMYILVKQMKLRSWMDQVIRSFQLYGRTIVENTIRMVDAPMMLRARDTNKVVIAFEEQIWPYSRVVDPFGWFAWPETANTLDEMQIIFEDTMISYSDYMAMSNRSKDDDKIEPIKPEALGRPEWPISHQVRLQTSGLSDPENTDRGGEQGIKAGAQFVALTKAWYKAEGRWQMAWIVWNVTPGPQIVRFRPSPYPEPPYRFSFARQLPGEGYTSSQMDDLEPLNVWLNDEVNMTQDAHLTGMFPPVLIDPQGITREDSLVYRPRAKWFVDPDRVKFSDGRSDMTRSGMQSVAGVLGFMDSFSGTNPVAEGSPTRGMPRAGYAVSSLIQLAMADITAVAEQLEDEILTPTLGDLYRLGILFTLPEQGMRLPAVMGLPKQRFNMADLYGDYTFRWVGSLQAQDMQVKAQRMVTFMGMIAKMGPMIQQSGKKINLGLLLKRIWREGMSERGAETIIEDMNANDALMAMLMKAGLGQPGGPGGGPGAPGVGEGANPATVQQLEQSQGRSMGESQGGGGLE